MTIENLIRVVPPPERPGDPFSGSWREIEAKLGTALPSDYKALVALYGLGHFMEDVSIWTPQAYKRFMRLEFEALQGLKILREVDEFLFPLWPEPGGLLPFGTTVYSDYLTWRTEGPPDAWRITVVDRGSGFNEVHDYDLDLTDFLAGVALNEIDPPLFEYSFSESERVFTPDPRGPAPLVVMTWRLGLFGSAGSGQSVSRLGRR